MQLQELMNRLVEITARPDKKVLMEQAINKACQRISIMHYFPYDLRDYEWTVDPEGATAFSIYLSDIWSPNIRKFEWVKVKDTNRYLQKIDPRDIFCSGRQQTEVYYRTGDALYINLAEPALVLQLGFYVYPSILDIPESNNWVSDMFPYVVLDGAAATVFKAIGDDTSAARHEEDFRIACAQLTTDLKFGEA